MKWNDLEEIVARLNVQENGNGHWNLFSGFTFCNSANPRDFPIIMTTLKKENPNNASQLSLDYVKEAFRSLM
jgi:hypothetical protein